jgi:hypothetical protein
LIADGRDPMMLGPLISGARTPRHAGWTRVTN